MKTVALKNMSMSSDIQLTYGQDHTQPSQAIDSTCLGIPSTGNKNGKYCFKNAFRSLTSSLPRDESLSSLS